MLQGSQVEAEAASDIPSKDLYLITIDLYFSVLATLRYVDLNSQNSLARKF